MSTKPYMMWKLAIPLCFVIVVSLATSAKADVRLPHVFGDDMVLQRDKPIPIWGWANAGETVTVKFAGKEKSTIAAADGKWMVRLDSLPANHDPQELTAAGNNIITLHNVLVGDVWLCSGDFGVFWEMFAVLDAEKEIARADFPSIRLLKVAGKSSNRPLDDIEGAWRPCAPTSVTGFSALAYFFGRSIHQETKVPVGLIDASYRYSYARSWIPHEGFQMIPELKRPRDIQDSWDSTTPTGRDAFSASLAAIEMWLPQAEQAFRDGKPIPKQPRLPAPLPANDSNYGSIGELSLLYQGMIHPIAPLAIRGVVWSQGENGCLEADKFRFYMRGLIESWRKAWGQDDLPFYIELLPSIGNAARDPGPIDYWSRIREEQLACVAAVPNTGVAVTFDVSDYVAQSRNRQDPGRRLALVALAKEYRSNVIYSGPTYRNHRIEDNRVVIGLDHVGGGLMIGDKNGLSPTQETKDGVLKGFTIAGADKQWFWADARIEGETVVVTSDKVPAPTAVRYAYSSNPAACNLYNRDGLPAVPFRTDAW